MTNSPPSPQPNRDAETPAPEAPGSRQRNLRATARRLVASVGPAGETSACREGTLETALAVRALLPLLERWAPLSQVAPRQEFIDAAMRQSRREGAHPVHVAFAPLPNVPLSSEGPNVAFTSWAYADIPRGKGFAGAEVNWLPALARLSLLITNSRFAQRVLFEAGVAAPVDAIPTPVDDAFFTLSTWRPGQSAVWDGPAYPLSAPGGSDAAPAWTFPVVGRMVLEGVVFTAVVEPADAASNWLALIDSYLDALADSPDALLVIKLAVEQARDQPHIARGLQYYRALARRHSCRLALLAGEFNDAQLLQLATAGTFHVNVSRAAGNCLPLQTALAAGRPVIAGRHSALADYVDPEIALVVKTRPEPAVSPLVQQVGLITVWHEIDRCSLSAAFRAAYDLAHHEVKYQRMAQTARRRMVERCSNTAVSRLLFSALDRVGS